MPTDNPSLNGSNSGISTPNPSEIVRPEIRRTLIDLLVQDEVSDSDMEILEKNIPDDEQFEENSENISPDMCVECGDQVLRLKDLLQLMLRKPQCGVTNAKNNSAKYVTRT